MEEFITITELLKNKDYNKVISRSSIERLVKNNKLISKIKNNIIYIDKYSFEKYLNLPKNFYEFEKLTTVSKKYNVSAKTIHDYRKKNLIEGIIILDKWYINKNDFLLYLEKIKKYSESRSRNKESRFQEFETKLDKLLGDEYERLEPFKGLKEKIEFKHLKCNKIFKTSPDSILYSNNQRKQGTRCPYCFGTKKYTQEEIERLISDYTDGHYKVIGEYKNNKSLIEIKHLNENCKGKGKTFFTKINSILENNGGRCPYCQMSNGEEVIFEFLEKYKIENIYQKNIKIDNRNYFFDFYIPSEKIFIEFDGKQHFYDNTKFNFIETWNRDLIKNNFINTSSYKLIRISFNNIKAIKDILFKILINKTFRDYPHGEYEKLIRKKCCYIRKYFLYWLI